MKNQFSQFAVTRGFSLIKKGFAPQALGARRVTFYAAPYRPSKRTHLDHSLTTRNTVKLSQVSFQGL